MKRVELEGNLNLRDLGGYASTFGGIVRTGCLFRSDGLDALTDSDLIVIAGLGVRVVFDLRNDAERARRPDRLPIGVELHERETAAAEPATAGRTLEDDIRSGWVASATDHDFFRVYVEMVTRLAPELRRVVTLAADAHERPLLFHCAAGKDRTGLAAAVLLGLLGVDDETILDDYELTTTLCTEPRFAGVAHVVEECAVDADVVRAFISARRPVLATALAHIHATWGGYEAYARDVLGVDAEVPAQLRRRLLR